MQCFQAAPRAYQCHLLLQSCDSPYYWLLPIFDHTLSRRLVAKNRRQGRGRQFVSPPAAAAAGDGGEGEACHLIGGQEYGHVVLQKGEVAVVKVPVCGLALVSLSDTSS